MLCLYDPFFYPLPPPSSGESRFPLKVSVGIHSVHSTGISADVAHALYHRAYASGSAYNNDIAVLVLTKAVGPASGVALACLPSSGGFAARCLGFQGRQRTCREAGFFSLQEG